MGQSPTAKMQKITFDLKIKGKELTRASKKEEKKAKENKKKCNRKGRAFSFPKKFLFFFEQKNRPRPYGSEKSFLFAH
jgi:hypothetical protein